MMKIKYNDEINERQTVAEDYALRMDEEAKYEKSSKCYVVGKVRFLKHGMIEGLRTRKQVDIITEGLKDWEFTDEESKAEYDNLPVEEPVIPETLIIATYKAGITDDIRMRLVQLIDSHYDLLKKALGADDLSIKHMDTEVEFAWFRYPTDEEESAAYHDLVNHLIEKAKTSKVVSEPAKGDEKYVFSKFLYRLGIDGTFRVTRRILMKNLEGNVWKNATWKKKKAKKDEVKKAV